MVGAFGRPGTALLGRFGFGLRPAKEEQGVSSGNSMTPGTEGELHDEDNVVAVLGLADADVGGGGSGGM